MSITLDFDTVDGTSLSETLTGSKGSDNLILGRDGNDRLIGRELIDFIDGGAGSDTILGGFSSDVLLGGDGNDRLDGQGDSDLLVGGAGNDLLVGGSNTLFTGSIFEDLIGSLPESASGFPPGLEELEDIANVLLDREELPDILYGADGRDTLQGGAGFDILLDAEGNDLLEGGAGIDLLLGGKGTDTLSGGSDRDIFAFSRFNIEAVEDNFNFDIETDLNGEFLEFIVDLIEGEPPMNGITPESLSVLENGEEIPDFFTFSELGVDFIPDFNVNQDLIAIDPFSFPLPVQEVRNNIAIANAINGEQDPPDLFDVVGSNSEAATSDALFTYNKSNGTLFYNPNLEDPGFDLMIESNGALSGLDLVIESEYGSEPEPETIAGGAFARLSPNLSLSEDNFLFFYDLISPISPM